VFGQVGAEEIELPRLADPRVRRLLARMKVIEDAGFSRRFPAERWARVRITLKDGRVLASEPAIARGNPENPLTDEELRAKYRSLAEPVLGVERATRIERRVDALRVDSAALRPLIDDLLQAAF
jgi:2-methylcitrate dehydratase PrpD